MTNKINISSTALEKSIDVAKDFLNKLVTPAAEELGLLMRDSVALWKFKNQVRVLNKARAYCEKNNISVKAISPKLLSPLLDNAALEETDVLQDKWAILLGNMVDSDQNIQNHVFPYLLSQLSTDEFLFLERVLCDKKERVSELSDELAKFRSERPSIENKLKATIAELEEQIEAARKAGQHHLSLDIWNLEKKKMKVEEELRSLKYKEMRIQYELEAPQELPDEGLRDFELSNVVRLGLVKSVHDTVANSQSLEIPNDPMREYLTVDLHVDVESSSSHVLTELGELFIEACTEKKRSV